MALLDRFRPDEPTREIRQWRAEQQSGLAGFADGSFRCVEMTLVTGVVRYLETVAKAPHAASTFLTALIAIYVRGKIGSALYPAIERHDVSERARRRLYWAFWAAGIAIAYGSNWAIQLMLPFVAANTH